MTTQQAGTRQTPVGWPGSLPEWLVFDNLVTRQRKVHEVDFVYQSAFSGGRLEKGGLVVDFMFYDPPDLAISVLGEYFHYRMGTDVSARDIIARAQLAGEGVTLIFIDEDDIMRDVDFYVRDALRYRDHSKKTRG